jgi:hypothetical protein
MITDEQFQTLKGLGEAIRAAHAAFPGNRDIGLLHGMGDRLLSANRSSMTDEQAAAVGGEPKE